MTVNATLPRIPSIIAIWYSIAVIGEVPDKIWPVIIPGKNIMPIPTMELMDGRIAESNALSIISLAAILGVAPSIKADSTRCFCVYIPSKSLVTPREMPVMELPMIMPAIGIKYLGSYQGEILTTTSKKYIILDKVPNNMEMAIILLRDFESFAFVLLKILWIANTSIIAITIIVYRGFILSNR